MRRMRNAWAGIISGSPLYSRRQLIKCDFHLLKMRKEGAFGNVFMQRNEQRLPKPIN